MNRQSITILMQIMISVALLTVAIYVVVGAYGLVPKLVAYGWVALVARYWFR